MSTFNCPSPCPNYNLPWRGLPPELWQTILHHASKSGLLFTIQDSQAPTRRRSDHLSPLTTSSNSPPLPNQTALLYLNKASHNYVKATLYAHITLAESSLDCLNLLNTTLLDTQRALIRKITILSPATYFSDPQNRDQNFKKLVFHLPRSLPGLKILEIDVSEEAEAGGDREGEGGQMVRNWYEAPMQLLSFGSLEAVRLLCPGRFDHRGGGKEELEAEAEVSQRSKAVKYFWRFYCESFKDGARVWDDLDGQIDWLIGEEGWGALVRLAHGFNEVRGRLKRYCPFRARVESGDGGDWFVVVVERDVQAARKEVEALEKDWAKGIDRDVGDAAVIWPMKMLGVEKRITSLKAALETIEQRMERPIHWSDCAA